MDGTIPGAFGLRTEAAVLFGLPGSDGVLVLDDVALGTGAEWHLDGWALLAAAVEHGDPPVRFVVPVPEADRAQAARSVGLTVEESWWHRELIVAPTAVRQAQGGPTAGARIDVAGASGCFVSPPAIYDPGGAVLLVEGAVPGEGRVAALVALAEAAARSGAALAVAIQPVDDTRYAADLEGAGFRRHADFFGGQIHLPGRLDPTGWHRPGGLPRP